MVQGIAALLVFQLIGESLVFLTGFAVPGPVVGLALLFAAMLVARRRGAGIVPRVEATADALLANLGLLFVPAGVGASALWSSISGEALGIGVVTVVSAVITLAVTVWAFILTRRLMTKRSEVE